MIRPSLAVLLSALGVVGSLTTGAAPATAAPAEAATGQVARGSAADEDPFGVTLETMQPAVIPRRDGARVTLSGTVTNRSDETWTDINVHPFVSDDPIRSVSELGLAAKTESQADVGDRITTPGYFATIDELGPGESAPYTVRVPRRALEIGEDGVYWVGTHALGTGKDGRATAGRARSFMASLPANADAVQTALVAPIRREVRYAADGSVADLAEWAEDLGPGGRLSNISDFASASGNASVTWLVDPAVLDAVRRLSRGNPARDLGPPQSATDEPTAEDDAEAADEESPSEGTDGESSRVVEDTTRWATTWVARVTEALKGGTVLSLPYADPDLSAAAEHDPQLYRRASTLSEGTMKGLEIAAQPAVAPPSGYLDFSGVSTIDADTRIIVSDLALGESLADPDTAPTTIEAAGHEVSVYAAAVARGGPGPDDPLALTAVRQRILAEAGVRSTAGGDQPLVVNLPPDWDPGDLGSGFFQALDQPWLDLQPLGAASGTVQKVSVDDLVYPRRQQEREIGSENFAAADSLIQAGETLQNILTRNETVAGEVVGEALTATSYSQREDPTGARLAADAARSWIEERQGQVTIEAPPFVTLSSETGKFSVQVTNKLEEPVTVLIEATSGNELVIKAPEQVRLDPGVSNRVLLEARAARVGVYPVQLHLTDDQGTQVGAADDLTIRSNQVGLIIWVIMAVGGAILLLAIAVRLVRRVRRARA